MTGAGQGFKWKGQKAKGLLPVGSAEPGSSADILRDLLELAQQEWLGMPGAHNSLTWYSRKKTPGKKYCICPLLSVGISSLHLGFGPFGESDGSWHPLGSA